MGRAASRVIGKHLSEAALIDEPGDVAFLTVDELLTRSGPLRSVVTARRKDHDYYTQIDVPQTWIGAPEIRLGSAARGVAGPVRGIGVSPGTVEGRVRVLRAPDDDERFEPGDILVCRTTDPSWAALFFLAGAVVIDIGGPMSHGAIVARELGIPCVINTLTGSTDLTECAVVSVDGASGNVDVVKA